MMMQQQKQRTPLNRLLAPVESCNESGLVDVRTSTRSSSKSPIIRNQRTLETRTRTTSSTSRAAAAAAAATTATTKTAVSAATTCPARPTSSRHVQRSTTSVAPNSSVSSLSSSSWNSSRGSSSTSTSSSIRRLSVAAWALALLLVLASSCFGGAEAGSIMGDSFSKRSFMDIQCKGFYDRSHFARLDRICEDCYNLFREPQLHSLCRNNCFTSEYFKGCMDVLLLQDEEAKIQQAIKILHGADPGV
ncbi:A-agglutinin anchorage subunit [Trichogramma pretiosum]|uniref:A-agglutinin anchorage subunit n=1 Tax=Trichogramma pretiosum TaxID=7493 RepID=UPI0006C9A725|nr:A-agglutinin anchorage subunit [Trichogramma pretiosum]